VLLPVRSCDVSTFLVCAVESFFAVGAKVTDDFHMLGLYVIEQHSVGVMGPVGGI